VKAQAASAAAAVRLARRAGRSPAPADDTPEETGMAHEALEELNEQAEHAQHAPSTRPVALTMSILAVLLAMVSVAAHRAHTEELLLKNESTNQWARYQAKAIRRNTNEAFADLVQLASIRDSEAGAKLSEKYTKEVERYREEGKEIEAEARKIEVETGLVRRQGDRFDLAEIFLEVGLVLSSITLMSQRRVFWFSGLALGAVGLLICASAFAMH
jgi:Domain of unknown function (DUF4337)